MSIAEAALRGSAVALLLLLVTLALRAARRSAAARYSALFSLSAAAYIVESAPDATLQHAAWLVPIRLLSIGTPAVFWLWARVHFDDAFVPSRRPLLAWAGLVALGAVAMITDRWIAWRALQAASLLLVGLGVWQALAGRGSDLVESRRRLRVGLAIATALYIAAVNLSFLIPGLIPGLGRIAVQGSLITAIVMAGLTFVFSALLLAPVHAAPEAAANGPMTMAPREPDGPAPPVDAQEAAWLAALRALMDEQRIYREEGLGIGALANRLGLPEYRLRRLINQRLGHRNFSDFVNGYRLAETMAALSDPSQDAVPILTIALDAGFQSIGPFNRAFKAHFGVTPSEFRRRELGRLRRPAAD